MSMKRQQIVLRGAEATQSALDVNRGLIPVDPSNEQWANDRVFQGLTYKAD